jgi:hypothetical protein
VYFVAGVASVRGDVNNGDAGAESGEQSPGEAEIESGVNMTDDGIKWVSGDNGVITISATEKSSQIKDYQAHSEGGTDNEAPWCVDAGNVTDIVIADDITNVGAYNIVNITSLNTLTIGSNVTSLPENFCDGAAITTLIIKNKDLYTALNADTDSCKTKAFINGSTITEIKDGSADVNQEQGNGTTTAPATEGEATEDTTEATTEAATATTPSGFSKVGGVDLDGNNNPNIVWTVQDGTLTFTYNENSGGNSYMNSHANDTPYWLDSSKNSLLDTVKNVVIDDNIQFCATGTLKSVLGGLSSIDTLTIGSNVKTVDEAFCEGLDIGEVIVKGDKTSIVQQAFKDCTVGVLDLSSFNETSSGVINTYAIATDTGSGKMMVTLGGVVGNAGTAAERLVRNINDYARSGDCLIQDDSWVAFGSLNGAVMVTQDFSKLPSYYNNGEYYCKKGESSAISDAQQRFLNAVNWDSYKNGTIWPFDISGTAGSANVLIPVPTDWSSRASEIKVLSIDSDGAIEVMGSALETQDGSQYLNVYAKHFSPYALYLPSNNVASTVEDSNNNGNDNDDSDDDDDDDDDSSSTQAIVLSNGNGGNGVNGGVANGNAANGNVANGNAANGNVAGNANLVAANDGNNTVVVQQAAGNSNLSGYDETPKTGKFPVLIFFALVLALMGTGMLLITRPIGRQHARK